MSDTRPIVYIRFKSRWLAVRILRDGKVAGQFEGFSQIALRRKAGDERTEIVAAGDNAEAAANLASDVHLCVGFYHPRVIFDKFDDTKHVLEHFVEKASGDTGSVLGSSGLMRLFKTPPHVLFHMPAEPEGGLTEVEKHALKELGAKLGWESVAISEVTHDLSDAELLAFPWEK